ncbi:hypothetical protein BJ742DRAFT_348135 [Cladochytrium replicatum]|nr:hypothetical protein BJ742DRAFT_348135 [Cladochytrium replicatum]
MYIWFLPSDRSLPPRSLCTLRSVVAHQSKHIPYSNLGAHYPRATISARFSSVDPDDPATNTNPTIHLPSLHSKLLVKRYGGYCLENNLLLAAALSALGFTVLLRSATVILSSSSHESALERPESHLLLIVGIPPTGTDDGSDLGPFETPRSDVPECASWWLCDVGGIYYSPIEPVPFRRAATGRARAGRSVLIDLVEWSNTYRWVLFYRHAEKETPALQSNNTNESLNSRDPDPRGNRFYMWVDEDIEFDRLERMNRRVCIPSRCPPGDQNELVAMVTENGGGIMVVGKESNGWKVVARNPEGEEVENYTVHTLEDFSPRDDGALWNGFGGLTITTGEYSGEFTEEVFKFFMIYCSLIS